MATPTVGESTKAAVAAAEAWLAEQSDDEAAGPQENYDQSNESVEDG